jgi:hypothetical protein
MWLKGLKMRGLSRAPQKLQGLGVDFTRLTRAATRLRDGLQENHGSIPSRSRYFPVQHLDQISSGTCVHNVGPGAVPLGVKRPEV